MKTEGGKISLGGVAGFDNPLDYPYPKKNYSEGKESARISYRRIWLDRYADGEYGSWELKLLSNGKAFLDGVELRKGDDMDTVNEIFAGLKFSS